MNNPEPTSEDKLSSLVNAYDLDGIIKLSQEEPQDGIDAWRNEIMESGFMALYSYLSYDQMCGKLGEGGLDYLDEVVESAEVFYGKPLRKLRSEVLNYRFDEVKDTDVNQAKVFALQSIDELSFEISTDNSALKFRAHVYHQLAELDVERVLYYWKLAIEDLKTAGEFNVWILYHQWPDSIEGMHETQLQVLEEFNQRMNQELIRNPDHIWSLLDDAARMDEYRSSPELKKQLVVWLQMSLTWRNEEAAPMTLRNAGLLLHKQGKAHQQPDCFSKAIECFERFITKDRAHAMEVYYMANVWEDWASLLETQGGNGAKYFQNAWDVYSKYEEVVRINFSPLLHYAEFLQRLYFNDKITERPTREKILTLAVEAEVMGNGYYGGPGMIQARIAISDDDAETAIYHLCRLLLRHELCIDNLIKNLRESLTDKAPEAVAAFLDETLKFMDDVTQGYFYDPKYSMAELNELSREATLIAWQERMVEIRNRPPRNFNS